MATPRKRWFKVGDKILREDWTAEQRSTFLGLLAWFNMRRQRDGHEGPQAQEASIPPGDLLTITLRDNLDEARDALSRIAKRHQLSIKSRGRFTVVRWPKLAEFQGWDTPASGPEPAGIGAAPGPRAARELPSPTPTPTPGSDTEEEERPTGGAKPPSADAMLDGWEWVVPIVAGKRADRPEREKAARAAFRCQWPTIVAEARERTKGGDRAALRRNLLAVAHEYAGQALKNPESVTWAQNANARQGEAEAAQVRRLVDDLAGARRMR